MFNSLEYAGLLITAAAVVWGLRNRPLTRSLALIALSGFFFVRANLGHPLRLLYPERFSAFNALATSLGLLLLSSVADFIVSRQIARSEVPRARRLLLATSIALDLGILCVFKYFNFFAAEAGALTGMRPLHLNLLCPIGISFYTFQAVSYVTDVYRGKTAPAEQYTDYLLYLSFFPQLLMGPIVRAADLMPKLKAPPSLTAEGGSRALFRIAVGLIKKSAGADFLRMHAVDPVFGNPGMYSSLEILTAVYAYAFQIYLDFSAYTDIAVGSAALLGIEIPENFNAPYLARSLREFWHRWHITLSHWLRDYLYIPLGGSRRSEPLVAVNLMITMVLGGLWHGASMNYLIWGTIHGAALAITRAVAKSGLARKIPERVQAIAGPLLTFHIVTAAWVFFRAKTFKGALDIFRGLFTFEFGTSNITAGALMVLGIAAVTHFIPKTGVEKTVRGFHRLPAPVQALLFIAAVYGADCIGAVQVSPFIYSQY